MASKRNSILVIAGIFPPDIGGPAGYLRSVIPELHAQGTEISVITYSDVEAHEIDTQLPCKVIRVSRRKFMPLRELTTILIGIREAFRSDLIFSNGNDFKAMLIGFFSQKKRIHKIVGDVAWERAQNKGWYKGTIDEYQFDPSKNLKLQILDFVRAIPIRTAYQVITPSEYLKKIVTGWKVSPSKIKVIYNAYTPPQSREKNFDLPDFYQNEELVKLVTICRLVPWKGVDTLLKVIQSRKNLTLTILGDGPLLNTLKEQAKELGVEQRVCFVGRVEKSRIPHFLENSDIFILNSSYEGLPHVILEAMDAGTPSIASAVGGTPEVLINDQTGYSFSYNSEDEILQAIDSALINQEKLRAGASQLLASKFSFSHMISELSSTLN